MIKESIKNQLNEKIYATDELSAIKNTIAEIYFEGGNYFVQNYDSKDVVALNKLITDDKGMKKLLDKLALTIDLAKKHYDIEREIYKYLEKNSYV